MNRAIKSSIVIFIVATIYSNSNKKMAVNGAKITVEQMQQATEPVRMVCIQKSKVSEESLENMRAGKLNEDEKELKCYVNCVMEMMQMVKKGRVNVDSVYKNIDTLMPEELREAMKRAVGICKDVGNGIKDYCEISFKMLKCLYKENPNFYFP